MCNFYLSIYIYISMKYSGYKYVCDLVFGIEMHTRITSRQEITNHESSRITRSREGPKEAHRSEEMKNLIIPRFQNEDLKITFDQSKKGGGS